MAPGAAREGVTEAARRLSHALAEMAAVLDNPEAAQKAKDVLKEWGVA